MSVVCPFWIDFHSKLFWTEFLSAKDTAQLCLIFPEGQLQQAGVSL